MDMSSAGRSETFETRSIGALFSGGTIVLALVLGGFAGAIAYGTGGQSLAIPVGVVVAVLAVGGVFYSNAATTVYATSEAIVMESGSPWGTDQQFLFEDIDVVLRKSTFADSLLGTSTYQIVRTGGKTGTVWFLSNPDRFERLVNDSVMDPYEQYRESNGHEHEFWYLWPHDRERAIPETPVVEEEELESALDVDLSDVNLDGLDDAVEMGGIDDFGDVAAAVEASGDAGAFDDSGGGGGGVGGGE
jgi:hypothetical protein